MAIQPMKFSYQNSIGRLTGNLQINFQNSIICFFWKSYMKIETVASSFIKYI